MIDKCCLCNCQVYHFMYWRQKCVNVRNICPSRMIVGFSGFRQRILQGEGTNLGGLSCDPRLSYVYIFSVSYSSISGGQIHNFSWQNSEFGSQIIKHRYPQNRSKVNSELIPKIVSLYAKILETDWVISILMWLILQISRTEIFGGIFIRYRAIG